MPGELRTVSPLLAARPDLGLTCASKPWGICIIIPVGTILKSLDLILIFFSIPAFKSKPDACSDPYSGFPTALLSTWILY